MKLDLFQIDAFTDKVFSGNPACVVPLKEWLPDHLLLQIARENAVAETAFFIRQEKGFHLRWFTPDIEMDLCGHATLATAHALTKILNEQTEVIHFNTRSGELLVRVKGDFYTLDFPSRKPEPAVLPAVISQSISHQPVEVWKARDYLLVYENRTRYKGNSMGSKPVRSDQLKSGWCHCYRPRRVRRFCLPVLHSPGIHFRRSRNGLCPLLAHTILVRTSEQNRVKGDAAF